MMTHELVFLVLYILMFSSLVALTGTYWLVWRIRKSKHILALSLFITSITFYVMMLLTKAFNRAYETMDGHIVDTNFMYGFRITFVLVATCFFLYTSWEQEKPKDKS